MDPQRARARSFGAAIFFASRLGLVVAEGEGTRSPITPSQIFSGNRYQIGGMSPGCPAPAPHLHRQPLGLPLVGQEGKGISPLTQEITGMKSLHTIPAVKKCVSYQISINATFFCTKKRISGLSLRYLKQTHTAAPTADTHLDLFLLLATCERWPVWKQVVNTLLQSKWTAM